jgi:hypothetical protein
MWKVVYVSYKLDFPKLDFQEETLQETLWETLGKLKTGTSNEEGSYIMVLRMKKCWYN